MQSQGLCLPVNLPLGIYLNLLGSFSSRVLDLRRGHRPLIGGTPVTDLSVRGVLLSLLLGVSASAATWHVDDDGADHDGADFVSIQAAIDAAGDGDVIVVHPGLYVADPGASEVVDTLGKKVNIQSSGGHENTIIDGQGTARGLVCTSGETS